MIKVKATQVLHVGPGANQIRIMACMQVLDQLSRISIPIEPSYILHAPLEVILGCWHVHCTFNNMVETLAL